MASDVLITGGAGFIGSRLATALVAAGHDVTVADVLHPQVHDTPGRPTSLAPGVNLLPVDVTSAEGWSALLHLVRPGIVVHLAAETGTGQSLTEASRHASVNVVGTTRMLDAMTAAGHTPDHFLLASSRAVYGEGAWARPDGTLTYPSPRRHDDLEARHWDPVGDDGAPLRPVASRAAVTSPHPSNVYAATKLAQEHILGAWCAAMGPALTTLRLQNVFGPGQSPRNSYTGILTLFVASGRRRGRPSRSSRTAPSTVTSSSSTMSWRPWSPPWRRPRRRRRSWTSARGGARPWPRQARSSPAWPVRPSPSSAGATATVTSARRRVTSPTRSPHWPGSRPRASRTASAPSSSGCGA